LGYHKNFAGAVEAAASTGGQPQPPGMWAAALFEAQKRLDQARDGLRRLKDHVDCLIVIDNEKIKSIYGSQTISQAFAKANDVLNIAAKGIAEIITLPGYINVDFADVRTVMTDSGVAIMGAAQASGEDRAIRAITEALESPVLNNNDILGAKDILLNITSGTDEITMDEMSQITSHIIRKVGNNAAVIFAVALLFAGIASTITSGMAAGSIFAGIYREPYDIKDSHSRWGVLLSLVMALIIIMLVSNPFMGLIYSQMILSIQLPITIFLQVYLTSSGKVMGKYKNRTSTKWILYILGGIVTVLNVMLFISMF